MAGDTESNEGATRSLLRLARHGETNYNAQGLIQGHDDRADLTQRGWRQAHDLAAKVRVRPIQLVVTSDLRRARHTAEVVAEAAGASLVIDSALRERSLGALEGLPTALASPALTGIRAQRVVDPHARPVGGESLHEVHRRIENFLDAHGGWFHGREHGDVVVVSHGGTVRLLVAALVGVPLTRLPWVPLPNAQLIDLPDRRRDVRRPTPIRSVGGMP